MVRLACTRPGWGRVRDPETDEYVPLNADVEPSVAERLADRYDPVSIVESEDDEDADENEHHTCAGMDGACSREVESPGDYCWQHL